MKRGSEENNHETSPSATQRLLLLLTSMYSFFLTSATQRLHYGEISTGERSGDVYIPSDLTVVILKKLPAKSLVRFRSVSKQWSSIISDRRDFIDSIVTRSLAQPQRMHFIFHHCTYESFFIFSSAYQNVTDNESVLISGLTGDIYQYLRGLIICWSCHYFSIGIYNPTTRQALYLPVMKPMHLHIGTFFFGYDPLDNQYKVLYLPHSNMEQGCHVFTLRDPTAKKWRNIKGIGHHYPVLHPVCINGAIYYRATAKEYGLTYVLMSFDVRSEKFDQVQAPKTLMDHRSALINYQGKLGFMCCQKGVEIWVMDNTEKSQKTQEWSKIFFYQMKGFENWCVTGVTRGGEIVFLHQRYRTHDTLSVAYYDPKRNSLRYVDIEGIHPEELNNKDVLVKVVPDHVENTMSLY